MSFLLILAVTSIAFALIFFIAKNDKADPFVKELMNIYRLDYADFQDYDGILESIIFLAATIINPLILLNMLIAMMGETFSRV